MIILEQMERFTCDWIFHCLVVLCDGTVVCGCADPYGDRPLGSIFRSTLMEIWNSATAQSIRSGINEGHSPFCLKCGLKRQISPDEKPQQRPLTLETLPRIFLEPTAICNLSCYRSVCSKESGILKTRESLYFPLDKFKEIIDPVAQKMVRIDLFNYGEPFLNSQTIEMIEYVKSRYPHIYVYISTNGLTLKRQHIERIVRSRMDEITFSIDGATQRIYQKYRIGGHLSKAVENIKFMVALRNATDCEVPFVNLRCILFNWNDSWLARYRMKRLAKSTGVDRLTWEITDHPADAASKKFQVGSKIWKKHHNEIWDTSQITNAIQGKKYKARIQVVVREISSERDQQNKIQVKVTNTGGAFWWSTSVSGKRFFRLGAQLYDSKKQLIDRDYARGSLNRHIPKGSTETLEVILPPISHPGDYYLKLDMVCEGIDWFESAGSPIVWCAYRVKSKSHPM